MRLGREIGAAESEPVCVIKAPNPITYHPRRQSQDQAGCSRVVCPQKVGTDAPVHKSDQTRPIIGDAKSNLRTHGAIRFFAGLWRSPHRVPGHRAPGAGILLNFLLDSGVNLIDTAASYRESEEVIGESISSRRDEFVLVSKCGSTFDDLRGEAWSAQLIAATINRSLKRLNTDHLDVMMLHSCSIEVLKKGEAIAALVNAKKAGKIRHAGYSGDNDAAQYAAAHPDIDVLQTSVNITDQWNIERVLPIAPAQRRRHGQTPHC